MLNELEWNVIAHSPGSGRVTWWPEMRSASRRPIICAFRTTRPFLNVRAMQKISGTAGGNEINFHPYIAEMRPTKGSGATLVERLGRGREAIWSMWYHLGPTSHAEPRVLFAERQVVASAAALSPTQSHAVQNFTQNARKWNERRRRRPPFVLSFCCTQRLLRK